MSNQSTINNFDSKEFELPLGRRGFLLGAGTVLISSAVALNTACAQSPSGQEKITQATVSESHNHNAHGNSNEGLISASLECERIGQACIDHCMELLKAGDTSIAVCADSVLEMLAFCEAFTKLASYKSAHLKAAARICIVICEDCEKECRKFEAHHAECKKCAEACRNLIDSCRKILA
jgi:Cys-rich four helix bundle protein (predicted Tat secretion target)